MMRGFLSLGTNLGDRASLLSEALRLLEGRGLVIARKSRRYETVPVEVVDAQGSYLNMVAEFTFGGGALELLDLCQGVERALGRDRPYVHAPRTMDIDIILLEGVEVAHERLAIPHPRMEQRAFVIHPLAEIAPDLILPSGRTATEVGKALGDGEIIRILDG
ncbi:MAG TPA: 2-amino-4-hydroxy-6-hydroxymethyldihydropteridine diphosphokinase [Deltaproteobacteria bacterium]|nr:2-amino-4-hydroxy-6-hydroxymethyldihydropteridine diphosphokinase [Deltaproteobacteria bacterium]HPR56492.1 2-amino-4-hydroxy-6-hydroxymethyldihydropteridine diphosphokinase [Deltaproteobacteria bacterium]HXK48448.1 2-amino-4-hydroxy-6-hydroxymethyldihydropteridine diphosphokinase [Deltaproteobacteria bacterium]